MAPAETLTFVTLMVSKPAVGDGDGVGAQGKIGEVEVATAGGDGLARDACGIVGDLHLSAGDCGARGIGYGAVDGAAKGLRAGEGAGENGGDDAACPMGAKNVPRRHSISSLQRNTNRCKGLGPALGMDRMDWIVSSPGRDLRLK